MATTLSLIVTEDGLHLPRQLFEHLGEVEVIERDEYILIKPKSDAGDDVRTRAIAALREAGLIVMPDWPPQPAVSPAERTELTRKLSVGKSLSEIIIEERADRA